MIRKCGLFLVACAVATAIGWTGGKKPLAGPPEPHRSPVDLAILPDGKRVLTANHNADSVSLVDLESAKVLQELKVGRKPSAIACSPDGKRVAISNLWTGSLSLLELAGSELKTIGEVAVGAFPRGLVFSRDGTTVYCTLGGADEVVAMDWATKSVRLRWPAPREPRQLALSHDGRFLAAASTRSGQVRCWNLFSGKLHWERTIDDGFNLRGLSFTPDDKFVLCAHVVHRSFPVTRDNIEKGWVIDSRVTRLAVTSDGVPNTWQIALDVHGRAVGDPHGLAAADDGRVLAIAAGGTHELLLLDAAAVPWNPGDPGDFLDPRLLKNNGFRRVELGGRPLAVAASPTRPQQVVVANYVLDAVQLVDVRAGQLIKTISLGGPKTMSAARKGEAAFYDARRSHNQWFSCHTCHVDGHTCGLNFDTLNDDSYGNPKLTPSLHNVTRTGPWTWHGIQKDLAAGVRKSLTQTMFGPEPSKDDIADLLAFLDTLVPPPHPGAGKKDPGVERGEKLFHGKAGCVRCHRPPLFTSPGLYDVKLDHDGSPYKLWNPPSLISLYQRGPYLHDGRAKTLDALLREHHTPSKLGGDDLRDQERVDLIAFLQSL